MKYNVNIRTNYEIGILDNALNLKKDLADLINRHEDYVR